MSWKRQEPCCALALALVAACSSAHRPDDLDRDRDGAIDERDESNDSQRDAAAPASAIDASHVDASRPAVEPPRAGSGGSGGASDAGVSELGDAMVDCAPASSCDPDPSDGCSSLTLAEVEAAPVDAHLLVIFDRSGSMVEPWGDLERWQAAGEAVQRALEPVADQLTVGALFFPTPDPACVQHPVDCSGEALACNVHPLATDPQIAFQPGDEFLATFAGSENAPPFKPGLPLGTPLLEALEQAQSDLAATPPAGPLSVAIITDGDPNCDWDAAAAADVIESWFASDVATSFYAIPSVDFVANALDELASLAGTEVRKPSVPAELENELVAAFAAATHRALPCTFPIEPDPTAPDSLQLVVTRPNGDRRVPHNFGWELEASSHALVLSGELCEAAQRGDFTAIKVQSGCEYLPPLAL